MVDKVKKISCMIGITLAVYLGMKYLLPIVAPFFVAFLLTRCIYPLADRIGRRLHLKKQTISVFILLFGTIMILVLLWLLLVQVCSQIGSVIERLGYYEAEVEKVMQTVCNVLERNFSISADQMMNYLAEQMEQLVAQIQTYLLPGILQRSMTCAVYIVKAVGIFFIIFIAVILLMRDYDEIRGKLDDFSGYKKMMNIFNRLWRLGGAYLKAQGMIMLIVMAICVCGLWITGNSYFLLIGILIGLLDVLPFIGTGTILIPWAIICFLQADYFHGIAYILLFLVANTVREYLEPRMLGDKLGVYPIVIAMVVYAGIRIYGVTGVLLGPLTLLTIVECFREIYTSG